jgi:hypothetical protein
MICPVDASLQPNQKKDVLSYRCLTSSRTTRLILCGPLLQPRRITISADFDFAHLVFFFFSLLILNSFSCGEQWWCKLNFPSFFSVHLQDGWNLLWMNIEWLNRSSRCFISMELSSFWETASCAATQDFSSTLWNQKVHDRVRKSPSGPCPEPNQSSPYHLSRSLFWDPSQYYYPPTYVLVFQVVPFFVAFISVLLRAETASSSIH